jgi:hypothetical protein
MELRMIPIAACFCDAGHSQFPMDRVELLANAFLRLGDQQTGCAGNIPILVERCSENSFHVLDGEMRLWAARLASQKERRLQNINAIVVEPWETSIVQAMLDFERGAAPAANGHKEAQA